MAGGAGCLALDDFGAALEIETLAELPSKECVHQWVRPKNYLFDKERIHHSGKTTAAQFRHAPDWHQERAAWCIDRCESVLVVAPTSAGKSACAEYAMQHCLARGKKAVLTTPVKALSNQKFSELSQSLGIGKVQLLTGDASIGNRGASVLVCTTEIFRSMLYDCDRDVVDQVEVVIFDELHYIADAERGTVWEETVLLLRGLPITVLGLSATMPNALELAGWFCHIHHAPCHVVTSQNRPVPLHHLAFPGRLHAGRELVEVIGNDGVFHASALQRVMKRLKSPGERPLQLSERVEVHQRLLRQLDKLKAMPMICFCFSQDDCLTLATELAPSMKLDDETLAAVQARVNDVMKGLLEEDRRLPDVRQVMRFLAFGIGLHHGGLVPVLRELVEILFQERKVQVLFATETFGMGVNMPARTVAFSFRPGQCFRKWNGHSWRWLTPAEYAQMGGRAGRRGDASEGRVVSIFDVKLEEKKVASIIARPNASDPVQSSFRPDAALILRALRQGRGFLELLLTQNLHAFQQGKVALMPRADIPNLRSSNCPDLSKTWEALKRFKLINDDHELLPRGEAVASLDAGGNPLFLAAFMEIDGLDAFDGDLLAALMTTIVHEPADKEVEITDPDLMKLWDLGENALLRIFEDGQIDTGHSGGTSSISSWLRRRSGMAEATLQWCRGRAFKDCMNISDASVTPGHAVRTLRRTAMVLRDFGNLSSQLGYQCLSQRLLSTRSKMHRTGTLPFLPSLYIPEALNKVNCDTDNASEAFTRRSASLSRSRPVECPHSAGEIVCWDPCKIGFSHDAFSSSFRDGRSVLDGLAELRGGKRKQEFEMIRVYWFQGQFFTLANRRLAMFRLFKFHLPEGRCHLVKVRVVSRQEAHAWGWQSKFTTGVWQGRMAKVRETGEMVGRTAQETTVIVSQASRAEAMLGTTSKSLVNETKNTAEESSSTAEGIAPQIGFWSACQNHDILSVHSRASLDEPMHEDGQQAAEPDAETLSSGSSDTASSSDDDNDGCFGSHEPPAINPKHVVEHVCTSSISHDIPGRLLAHPVTSKDLVSPWCNDARITAKIPLTFQSIYEYCRSFALPMLQEVHREVCDSVQSVKLQGFRVHGADVQFAHGRQGLRYRAAKQHSCMHSSGDAVLQGSLIYGKGDSDWVKVDNRFLPLSLEGRTMLQPEGDPLICSEAGADFGAQPLHLREASKDEAALVPNCFTGKVGIVELFGSADQANRLLQYQVVLLARRPESMTIIDAVRLGAQTGAVASSWRLGVIYFCKPLASVVEPTLGFTPQGETREMDMPPMVVSTRLAENESLNGVWQLLPVNCGLTTYIRVSQALSKPKQHCPFFWQDKISGDPSRHNGLFTHMDAEDCTSLVDEKMPDLNEKCQKLGLNPSQQHAVKHVLVQPHGTCLIRGPPGTGKTQMLVAMLDFLLQKRQRCLVCAPTNIAVREIVERLVERVASRGDTMGLAILAMQERLLGVRQNWGPQSVSGPPQASQRCSAAVAPLFVDRRKKSLKRICKFWLTRGKDPWPGSGGTELESLLEALQNPQGSCAIDGCLEQVLALRDVAVKQKASMDCELSQNSTDEMLSEHQVPLTSRHERRQHQEQIQLEKTAWKACVDVCDALDTLQTQLQRLISNLKAAQVLLGTLNDQGCQDAQEAVTTTIRQDCESALSDLRQKAQRVRSLDSLVMRSMILRRSLMIFCTVTGAGSRLAQMQQLPTTIIDEACMVRESESVIVLRAKLQRLVLIGDPKQLPAGVKSPEARRAHYERSLFERLEGIGHTPLLLNRQYRMHPNILAWSNEAFYGKLVETDKSVAKRSGITELCAGLPAPEARAPGSCDWRTRFKPMLLFDTSSEHTREQWAESSCSNPAEAKLVMTHLEDFVEQCQPPKEWKVGIITPYSGQVALFRDILAQQSRTRCVAGAWLHDNCHVSSVDGFQGQECDIIVISCVRAGGSSIGFLSDERRLNVAVTRAKLACWIFGNFEALTTLDRRDNCWCRLASFAKMRGWLLGASLGKLPGRLSRLDPAEEVPPADWSGSWNDVLVRMRQAAQTDEYESGYTCLACHRHFADPSRVKQHLHSKAGEQEHPGMDLFEKWDHSVERRPVEREPFTHGKAGSMPAVSLLESPSPTSASASPLSPNTQVHTLQTGHVPFIRQASAVRETLQEHPVDQTQDHLEALPGEDVFWLLLQSGQEAFCISHCDKVADDLWSTALNISRAAELNDLTYRDGQDRHTDDVELHEALAQIGGKHADQHFKRTKVGDIVAVGLAGNQKKRDRAVRIAAAVAFTISCVGPDACLPGFTRLWEAFPDLVAQAKAVRRTIAEPPWQRHRESRSPHQQAVESTRVPEQPAQLIEPAFSDMEHQDRLFRLPGDFAASARSRSPYWRAGESRGIAQQPSASPEPASSFKTHRSASMYSGAAAVSSFARSRSPYQQAPMLSRGMSEQPRPLREPEMADSRYKDRRSTSRSNSAYERAAESRCLREPPWRLREPAFPSGAAASSVHIRSRTYKGRRSPLAGGAEASSPSARGDSRHRRHEDRRTRNSPRCSRLRARSPSRQRRNGDHRRAFWDSGGRSRSRHRDHQQRRHRDRHSR